MRDIKWERTVLTYGELEGFVCIVFVPSQDGGSAFGRDHTEVASRQHLGAEKRGKEEGEGGEVG